MKNKKESSFRRIKNLFKKASSRVFLSTTSFVAGAIFFVGVAATFATTTLNWSETGFGSDVENVENSLKEQGGEGKKLTPSLWEQLLTNVQMNRDDVDSVKTTVEGLEANLSANTGKWADGTADGQIYYTSGNVGIGTNTPASELDVLGGVNATRLCINNDCKTEWGSDGGGSKWTDIDDGIAYGGVEVGSKIKTKHTIKGSITDSSINGASGIQVVGDYAYVVSNFSKSLTVIDISNPSSPTIKGSNTDSRILGATGIHVVGDYAYVVSNNFSKNLTVIDISNPSSPNITGSITDASRMNGATGIHVVGNYAYVGSRFSNSLTVIDISNPYSPTIRGNIIDV